MSFSSKRWTPKFSIRFKDSVDVFGVELCERRRGTLRVRFSDSGIVGVVPRVVGDPVGVSGFSSSRTSSCSFSMYGLVKLSADFIAGTSRRLGDFSARTRLGLSSDATGKVLA